MRTGTPYTLVEMRKYDRFNEDDDIILFKLSYRWNT